LVRSCVDQSLIAVPWQPIHFGALRPGTSSRAGTWSVAHHSRGFGQGVPSLRGLTLEDLALRLYPYFSRRAIDSTGLAGYFDGEFEFTAEIVMPPPPPGLPNPYDGRVLPSIFSVLPQQLGLRLESGRGPVEVLIVDHAERPKEE
jgi:uncharacterized protein (TIGR03435 family)